MVQTTSRRRLAQLAVLGLLFPAGCNIVGALAQLGGKPPIEAAYKNLREIDMITRRHMLASALAAPAILRFGPA